MDQNKFWKTRSEKYNNLKWVNDNSYIRAFIRAGNFKKTDLVLDVGTGTGVIAHSISPLVKEVIGLDISQDMLEHSNWKDNKYFIRRDIRKSIFNKEVFDKITARMVFHHIINDTQKAMNECYRLLKKGGKMILAEGVPPAAEVKKDYQKIFSIKEERITFLEEDLTRLMKKAGFVNIKVIPFIMNNFSVKNWLRNSGLSDARQKKIYEMHINGSDVFKKAYNLRIVGGDCLITTKSLIIVGGK